MANYETLKVHIKLESRKEPDRGLSPSTLCGTLQDIIRSAVQTRFPEYEVEVASLEAEWPGSDKEFPKLIKD